MVHVPRPKATLPLEPTPYEPATWAQIIISAAVIGLVLGVLLSQFLRTGPAASNEYHLWRWQADTLLNTAFGIAGIGPHPDETIGDEALHRYFALTSQIRGELDSTDPDVAAVDALASERANYENDVERVIQNWIEAEIRNQGLDAHLPLFRGVRITWPPVEFELTSPPQLLVRSPRSVIKRGGDTLLKNDLSLRDIERIEAATDDADTVSVVLAIGGLAAYPAIVRDDRSYDSLIETASHEWVHHYLAFYPLGRRFGKGPDGTRLNETTADKAGREIANLIRAAHDVDFAAGEDGRAPPGPPPRVDFNEVMRQLRIDVDALLAEGKIDQAEALMERQRLYLAENGYPIRKLNQAYFAFHGSYAAGAAAGSDPTGEKIDRVFELTGDVGSFLTVMRDVESTADLDALLSQLERSVRP